MSGSMRIFQAKSASVMPGMITATVSYQRNVESRFTLFSLCELPEGNRFTVDICQ